MGMSSTDEPEDGAMVTLIVDANTEMLQDANITDPVALRLALKFLAASYVSQNRAQRLINKGNVNFAIDGVSIQKPFKDFMNQAEYYRKQYDEFLWKFAEESIISTPIADAGYFEYSLVLIDIIHGVNNARNRQDVRSLSSNTAY